MSETGDIEETENGSGEDWEPATPQFASLEQFLQEEHLTQSASHEAVYDLTVEERVSSGRALSDVRYLRTEGEKSKAVHVFSCGQNSSRFRPGTRLRLSRRDPRRPAAHLELIEDRFDGKQYILRLSGTLESDQNLEGDPWVLDEDVFDLLGSQLSILRAAEESDLGDWLAGTEELPPCEVRPMESPFLEGLGPGMRTAFEKAVATRPYFAIQGPPGSGKTHLLARLALYYALEENKRVLVTAVSHQAIHHALGETYWVGRHRVGAHPGMKELLADGFFKLGASRGNNEGLPDGVRAVFRVSGSRRPMIAGATLYAAMQQALNFSKRPYDVILFDEAGQAPLLLALAARLLAHKVVFIGDDAQLPPVVTQGYSEDAGGLGRMSALQFLRREYEAPHLLTRTRRLNNEICSIVSECFYEGELSPTEDAGPRRLETTESPVPPFDGLLGTQESLVFLDIPHEDSKSICEREAAWAAAIAAEAVRCGIPGEEIGIIAPYRAQCNRIRFLMGKRSRIVCSTVERFQGQERELVILSLTSSHARYIARLAGFLFDPHRLNVAISRARTKVILLGARRSLMTALDMGEASEPDSPTTRGFDTFRRIISAAHIVDAAQWGMPLRTESVAAASVSGPAFEAGEVVEHPLYGIGHVLSKSTQMIDNKIRWVNEMRFGDGKVRIVVPALSRPPIRRSL